jgi:SAM-dependent methyltransferase
VIMDVGSRQWKALKIERLMSLGSVGRPLRLLEVGTGSGGIAHYFATHPSGNFEVDAVDVLDNRLVREGYRYTTVDGIALPFADESFDVVISNHVIEHVGQRDQQLEHLAELRRVLRSDGHGYLAVPNRWMLVEPHFQVAFLSWFPRRLRNTYLRLRGKGDFYDCEPLEAGELKQMLDASGLEWTNLCIPAMRETFAIERAQTPAHRMLERIPDWLLVPFRSLIPTLIFAFRRSRDAERRR